MCAARVASMFVPCGSSSCAELGASFQQLNWGHVSVRPACPAHELLGAESRAVRRRATGLIVVVATCALLGVLASSCSHGTIAMSAGLRFRALTRIRVREAPDVAAGVTGATVEPGQVFEAAQVVDASAPAGMKLIQLRGSGGWVFDTGIAGQWTGKPIVELLGASAAQPNFQRHSGMVRVVCPLRDASFGMGWDIGETVLDLKLAIEQKFRVPCARQELWLGEQPLGADSTPLVECLPAIEGVTPTIEFWDTADMEAANAAAPDWFGGGAADWAQGLNGGGPTPRAQEQLALYDVLGVSRDADASAIKDAYRKLVRKTHPDLANGKPDEERQALRKRFDAISFAYRCLSDNDKRRAYDNGGLDGLSEFEARQKAAGTR